MYRDTATQQSKSKGSNNGQSFDRSDAGIRGYEGLGRFIGKTYDLILVVLVKAT